MDWTERIARCVAGNDCPRMVYQPIRRLAGRRRLLGYEALSRFPDRSLTDVPPELLDDEGHGWGPEVWFAQADLVDMRVLLEMTAIVRGLAALMSLPERLYVAVNASPPTFLSEELPMVLGTIDGSRVVVELTEQLAVTDYDAIRASFAEVKGRGARVCTKLGEKSRGVRLAADDVGAGQASMRHVLELGRWLDFAKLDRSITAGVDEDTARQVMVKGIVAVGTECGFNVVAEGIETEEQATMLRSLGVHAGQGWHLGRPGAV